MYVGYMLAKQSASHEVHVQCKQRLQHAMKYMQAKPSACYEVDAVMCGKGLPGKPVKPVFRRALVIQPPQK